MDALDRVWAAARDPRDALERRLSPADLRTLWLGVARERAASVTPADVVRQWRDDRFVRPSAADPRALARVEAQLWDLLPASFAGVELSPVAPLGTCSSVAPVSQDRVLSTGRLTEVVSDPTNALAVEAAVRRRAGSPRVDSPRAAASYGRRRCPGRGCRRTSGCSRWCRPRATRARGVRRPS